MNGDREQVSEGSSGKFHILQPLRDLESNWAVDLAKNLEEYLLKICAGEIDGEDDVHLSVNFAEAALLLQGSIQVYSRKVEYLYSLVLHSLEFVSQKRQEDRPEKTGDHAEGGDCHEVVDEENELFLGLDDVPVEAKNCLDDGLCKDQILDHYVKPPANLIVLEGDCLDTTGDAGELESYLLATNDLYQGFLLLDPCDAVAVNDFLKGDKTCTGHNVAQRGSSLRSKTHKSFQSPTRFSGGTALKTSVGQSHDVNANQSPIVSCNFADNDNNMWSDPHACSVPENNHHGDEMDGGYSRPRNDSDDLDDDDPWKPLNPHEPGNLKVKAFRKLIVLKKPEKISSTKMPIAAQFPLARLCGTISSEFSEMWEEKLHAREKLRDSQSPPPYEKLRQSLVPGGHGSCNMFSNAENEDEDIDHADFPGFGQTDGNMPDSDFMDTEPPVPVKHGDDACFDGKDTFQQENSNSHANLEDLCRLHLDALLSSIAETEKQTELASRVSTWKQRIEHTLEEQDSHPPFDIHEYGGQVLDKLSIKADSGGCMSFADIVAGQEKHDVARTFSALLQLVNNGNVGLDRGNLRSESVCYSSVNPFYVRLLSHDKRQEAQLHSSKKRAKSPLRKRCTKVKVTS
ncbi:PREDICTED: condensin-2 complex subunit H2-like isoform X2 [Nelumbo nucifera]|uniref:Condensin-2 complex subunit H2 n=1 Tax=Nelumbo nucifera TaxID=4432 RepID=A0A1U8BMZ0_NELNU|nr:PREDICTED: condensin-2 complex subunit H2-like isoform X2 [Nelumbo nucifera]